MDTFDIEVNGHNNIISPLQAVKRERVLRVRRPAGQGGPRGDAAAAAEEVGSGHVIITMCHTVTISSHGPGGVAAICIQTRSATHL